MFVRIWPSVRHPVIGSDEGFHLLMRREIRRNRFLVPAKMWPCLFDNRVGYPWFYHQSIALIPESTLRRMPGLPSGIIDGLHGLLACAASYWLTQEAGYADRALWAGLVGGLLFGINPALLAHGMGPRAYSVTPRPFGELLFSAALFCGLLAIHQSSWLWGVTAAFAGGCMLLSSKFAAQVLLFFAPLLALLPGYAAMALLLPASLLSAMILSRGRYWDILKGQWVHLRWYRTKAQYQLMMVAQRNAWADFGEVGSIIRQRGILSRDVLRALGRMYTTNTYLLVLSRGGLFLVFLLLLVSRGPGEFLFNDIAMVTGLLGWAFIWLVPFMLTSTRHFRFMGEAERYCEYSILPVAILTGVLLTTSPWNLFVIVLLSLYIVSTFAVIGHAWIIHARTGQKRTREKGELVDFLQSLPEKSALLGIPAMHVLAPVASQLDHRFADLITDGVEFVKMFEDRCEGYPWPKPDWDMWKSYGVQYVVTSNPEGLRRGRPSLHYDFANLRLEFSNASYHVYAL